MKHLQKQAKPKGIELADDEIILHVEGTMASQRVVRHIKETSWPGLVSLLFTYVMHVKFDQVMATNFLLVMEMS